MMRTIFLVSVLIASWAYADEKDDADSYNFEYAVKFICGQPDVPVVAPGNYFTAINVHNPNHEKTKFRKKIAVALPSEKAGPVSPFYFAKLKYDEALEIDCPDILEHSVLRTRFLKGFVIIQSKVELDVVAVYTAGEAHVETIDTERVPYRLIAGNEIVAPGPEPEPEHCPEGGLYQRIGQEGCCCNTQKSWPAQGPQDWWPDCAPGLHCVSPPPSPSPLAPASPRYSVCVPVNQSPLAHPGIHHSQPRFCNQ